MLNIGPVNFDVSDCTLRERSEEHFGWSNENGVYIVLRVPKRPTTWSFDLHDIGAATSFFSQQSASNGGVLLDMELLTVGDRPALRGLFKYRSPIPQSMGIMFVSILWIRIGEVTAQINVESTEQGETGVREAAVCVMTGESAASASSSEPVLVDSIEEMFAHMRAQPLRALSADHSQYDQLFPDHPLSKVRNRMAQLVATLSITGLDEKPTSPNRPPWWKFW